VPHRDIFRPNEQVVIRMAPGAVHRQPRRNLPTGFSYSNQHMFSGGKIMKSASEYWRRNIRLVTGCLIVWFVVSFGFGILLVAPLNAINLGGYRLGFWFAQQGSLYIFVALIFFYANRMNKLDREFNVYED
jgi:putative solute:sodium symporter small subunit